MGLSRGHHGVIRGYIEGTGPLSVLLVAEYTAFTYKELRVTRATRATREYIYICIYIYMNITMRCMY